MDGHGFSIALNRFGEGRALEGVQSEIGLGIAKLHFELGAGNGSFAWAA